MARACGPGTPRGTACVRTRSPPDAAFQGPAPTSTALGATISGQPARRVVGVVLRPHGVKGEVAVRPETDNPDRFRAGTRVFSGDRELRIASARPHGLRWLVHFHDVGSREAADALRDAVLEIPASEARALGPDEYWPEDIVGRDVLQGGRHVGVVRRIAEAPAHDLLEVALDGGGGALVPFVAALVTVTAAGVDVAPLEGLLDPTGPTETGGP